jgi:hypothetical protein
MGDEALLDNEWVEDTVPTNVKPDDAVPGEVEPETVCDVVEGMRELHRVLVSRYRTGSFLASCAANAFLRVKEARVPLFASLEPLILATETGQPRM